MYWPIWFLPLLVKAVTDVGLGAGSFCETWLNPTPDGTFALTAIVLITLALTAPYVPADGRVTTEPAHNAFAWTERSRARKLARQAQHFELAAADAAHVATAHPSSHTADENQAAAAPVRPVCCFETAVKALFWSTMLYDFEDDDAHTLATLPPEVHHCMLLRFLEMAELKAVWKTLMLPVSTVPACMFATITDAGYPCVMVLLRDVKCTQDACL